MERQDTILSLRDTLHTSRNTYKKYFRVLLPMLVVLVIPGMLDTAINDYLLPMIPGAQEIIDGIPMLVGQRALIGGVISLLLGILTLRFQIGYINAELTALNDRKPYFKNFFSGNYKQILSFLGGGILMILLIIIGFIALIVPGIYFLIKFSLFKYYIAQGYGGITSLKASWKATKGSFWKIFTIFLVNIGIIMVGMIAGIVVLNTNIGLTESTIFISNSTNLIILIGGGLLLLIGVLAAGILVELNNTTVYHTLKTNTPEDIKPINL